MARGKRQTFQPVLVYDRMGFIRQLQLAAAAEGEDVTLLMADTTRNELYTREILIGQIGNDARYAISEKDPVSFAEALKQRAMKHGATPEAIRLLGQIAPISDEEYDDMAAANKLAPKADKEGLKAAAKKTPVGGKADKPAAKKGNPEALAKAREATAAKQAELLKDKRKITATDKGKAKLGKVEATDKLAIMIKAKTVGAALQTEQVAFKDIAYAEKVGLVTLG